MIAGTALVVVVAAIAILPKSGLTTNVTIPLSYAGDDGKFYFCTYDYRTSARLAMPTDIAESMNEKDWSQTGQLIYEWAKAHPAEHWTTEEELPADDPRSTRAEASWSLAMDRYVKFPPWTIDAGNGPEYELSWTAREWSNCEAGLR